MEAVRTELEHPTCWCGALPALGFDRCLPPVIVDLI
jgi:hypothetical protein